MSLGVPGKSPLIETSLVCIESKDRWKRTVFRRRPSKGKLRDVHPELTDDDEGVEVLYVLCIIKWDPFLGGSNKQQIYGVFEAFPAYSVSFGVVYNIMTPVILNR